MVTEEVLDDETKKVTKVEYQISPFEAWTGRVPKVHGHIKTWGCKVICHVSLKAMPGRSDKFMPPGYEGIMMGYDEHTTAHHRVYVPVRHETIVSSNVKFFEDLPGSTIADYQLWVKISD